MEKKYGSVKVDYAGRFVIPAKLREAMGLDNGGVLDVSSDGERIILEKKRKSCIICGAEGVGFVVRNDKTICHACCNTLNNN